MMNTKLTGLAVALFFSAGIATAAEPVAVQDQVKAQDQTRQTLGRQLMTDEERNAQRAKMRSSTPEEKEKIRAEHHEQMKERAKEQGASLPDNPPARGQGMGGGGMGGGMGGGGMGGGMGGGGRGGR
ncbi:MAG: hypothetical protein A2342_10085 [Gallionellales bacterium RIFOXYB12_FULL_54_9]|nr:MAG: hypothetical protein A2342_10085 [Gallionellales bacterium RIFOXYB12_FULL_54_9]